MQLVAAVDILYLTVKERKNDNIHYVTPKTCVSSQPSASFAVSAKFVVGTATPVLRFPSRNADSGKAIV